MSGADRYLLGTLAASNRARSSKSASASSKPIPIPSSSVSVPIRGISLPGLSHPVGTPMPGTLAAEELAKVLDGAVYHHPIVGPAGSAGEGSEDSSGFALSSSHADLSPKDFFLYLLRGSDSRRLTYVGSGSSGFVLRDPKSNLIWKVIPRLSFSVLSPDEEAGVADLIALAALEEKKIEDEFRVWSMLYPEAVKKLDFDDSDSKAESPALAGLLAYMERWVVGLVKKNPARAKLFMSYSPRFVVLSLPDFGPETFKAITCQPLRMSGDLETKLIFIKRLVESFLNQLYQLHERKEPIIHGDVALGNICYQNGTLVDYGNAKFSGMSLPSSHWMSPTPEFARPGARMSSGVPGQGVYEGALSGFDVDYYGAAWVVAALIMGPEFVLNTTPNTTGFLEKDWYIEREKKTKNKLNKLWDECERLENPGAQNAGFWLIHAFCHLLCLVVQPADLRELLRMSSGGEFLWKPLYLRCDNFLYEDVMDLPKNKKVSRGESPLWGDAEPRPSESEGVKEPLLAKIRVKVGGGYSDPVRVKLFDAMRWEMRKFKSCCGCLPFYQHFAPSISELQKAVLLRDLEFSVFEKRRDPDYWSSSDNSHHKIKTVGSRVKNLSPVMMEELPETGMSIAIRSSQASLSSLPGTGDSGNLERLSPDKKEVLEGAGLGLVMG